jgi:nucleotide-binding universal stress UspA family protein
VVGVDPCPASWIAVRWAASLAGWLDAEVIAAHALRPGLPRADVPGGSIGTQVAFTLERDWCAPLRAAAVPYRLVVREGSPVDVLQQVVETEAPELVVTGRHIDAQERGWHSTSLGILANPQVPTLVVPEPTRETAMPASLGGRDVAMRRILVGVDGSAPSLRALDWAVRLVGATGGGDVVVVSTIEEVPVFPLGPATVVSSKGEADAPARAAVMLARACAPARAAGARVHTVSRRGPPATVLVRMATLLDADLVAAGIRGVGRPDHPPLGHVSRRLVCRSPRPVLLTP